MSPSEAAPNLSLRITTSTGCVDEVVRTLSLLNRGFSTSVDQWTCSDMSVRFPCFVGCYSLFDRAGVVLGGAGHLLIKRQRTLISTIGAITLLNQSLTHSLARTEALCRRIEKARVGAYRLEANGTFCGTPLDLEHQES